MYVVLIVVSCRMFTARKKIVKELKDGKEAPIDAFEEQVAQVWWRCATLASNFSL
jgi:hypothetical protein